MIAPLTVTSEPNSDVSAPGRPATAAASSARVASTVLLPPAGTVTDVSESVIVAPSAEPLNADARSYVMSDPPVFQSVSGSVSL